MDDSAGRQYLYIQDQPILSLNEIGSYAYALPEDSAMPQTLTRWMDGAVITPNEILSCLRGEATEAAGDSDHALEIVRAALERLKRLFPDVTAS
jgi:hypothetical protein